MSVLDQVNRIKTAVANAYTAAENKFATIPATRNVASLATTIASIPVDPNARCNFELNNSCRVVDIANGYVSGFLNAYSYPGSASFKQETIDLILEKLQTFGEVTITLKFQPQYVPVGYQYIYTSSSAGIDLFFDGGNGTIYRRKRANESSYTPLVNITPQQLNLSVPFLIINRITPDSIITNIARADGFMFGSTALQNLDLVTIERTLTDLQIGCGMSNNEPEYLGYVGWLFAADCTIEVDNEVIWRGYE